MSNSPLYILSDNLLILDKLTDEATGSFINDATVVVTLRDSDGDEVSGQVWPFTMSFVAASDGKYQAVLEDGLSLTEYNTYIAQITADAGSDAISNWFFELEALKQR